MGTLYGLPSDRQNVPNPGRNTIPFGNPFNSVLVVVIWLLPHIFGLFKT